MKNVDIHNGLKDKEIRDFLSQSIPKISDFVGNEIHCREMIEKYQKGLVIAQKYSGALRLLEQMGWSEHDVSDDIDDFEPDTYFDFIGTKEEYHLLLEKAKKELEDI